MTVSLPLSTLHSILDHFGARLAIALILLLSAGLTKAAEIYVDGVSCQLSDAIIAANTDAAQFGCSAGAGADTLILLRDIKLQFGNLPSVTSDISIEYGGLAAQEESCDEEDPPEANSEDLTPTESPGNNPTPTDDPSNNPTPTDNPNNPSNNPTPTDDPSNDPTATDDPNNPSNNPTPTDDPGNNPTPTDPSDPPEQTFFQPTDPPAIGDPPVSPDATLTVSAKLTLTAPGAATATATATTPGATTATATLPPGGGLGDPEANSAPDIPSHCIHVVARNENLYRISLLYGMTLREISSFNGLVSDDNVLEGQELIIPFDECLQYAGLKG